MDVLIWLEQTALATWVRESPSLFAYPTILTLHTVGLAWLVGASTAINLRILGFAPSLSLRKLEAFFPVVWIGFAVNAVSGVPLLMADATTMVTNPVFQIKLGIIALSVAALELQRKSVLEREDFDVAPVPASGRVLAGASLLLWAGAITTGRLMAYVGPAGGLF